MSWVRVNSRKKILCPVCGHGDWCGLSEDRSVAICMRVESNTPTKNGGWLHRLSDPVPFRPVRPAIPEARPHCKAIFSRWSRRTSFDQVSELASSLGVDSSSLDAIGCAWNGIAWAFPMRDSNSEIIGIRLRADDGRKWALKGSRNGLFIPAVDREPETIWIVEGPTDTAAALSLGLDAIGKPSCSACDEIVVHYLRRIGARRVVIVSDNDEPGLRGAAKLQAMLPVMNCLWIPPCKDIREFLNLGGDKQTIEASIRDQVWTRPIRRAA